MILRLRMAGRLLLVGLHVAAGLLTLCSVYPRVSRRSQCDLRRNWSRRLLSILGIRLELVGGRVSGDLLLANHVSWLDIFVINAIAPATFISKREVRNWPLVGALVARSGTLFLERGNRSAAVRINRVLVEKLRQAERIAVFPEGTTSDGQTLLPFYPALLQSAIETGCIVQPLALRYADADGKHAATFAYCGQTSFWQSLCAIASTQGAGASVAVLERISAADLTRRELAERSRAAILEALRDKRTTEHSPLLSPDAGVAATTTTMTTAAAATWAMEECA